MGEPWSRHVIGRVFNWAVKLLVLRGINDTQCGFKLFSARAAGALFPFQRLDGFGFDVEILFLARRGGFAIREVPLTWIYGRESKVSVASGARGFLDILAVRWHQLRGAYPSRAAMASESAACAFVTMGVTRDARASVTSLMLVEAKPMPAVTTKTNATSHRAQPTSAVLTNGTTTLNSKISVAGTGLPTSYRRLTELTMLRVC